MGLPLSTSSTHTCQTAKIEVRKISLKKPRSVLNLFEAIFFAGFVGNGLDCLLFRAPRENADPSRFWVSQSPYRCLSESTSHTVDLLKPCNWDYRLISNPVQNTERKQQPTHDQPTSVFNFYRFHHVSNVSLLTLSVTDTAVGVYAPS